MADLEEVTETPRTGVNDDSRSEDDGGLARRDSLRRKGSKGRRNSGGSQTQAPLEQVSEGTPKGKGNEEEAVRPEELPSSPKPQDAIPTKEDHQARFYESYHKEAEGYDKDFLKKHNDDLDTTLIFAGLFSAVTSAFIIEVNSQLQPDPGDETAALLRVLIYKIDNTTFGSNTPSLPQWTGPPRAIVQVQAILFASLAVSLFSAFLAMLGKQWLNRYESIDRRGSARERSHNRQRKLDGIIVWYFDHVMESLPLMLQAGLLLLGCALSRYLWEVNIIVASVVLSVTSFGALFYLFILIAGSISESCPYQTPGAHTSRYILHHLRHRLLPALSSAFVLIPSVVSSNFSRLYQTSRCCWIFVHWWADMKRPWYSISNIGYTLVLFAGLFVMPFADAYIIGRAILQSLFAFTGSVYRKLMDTLGAVYSSIIIAILRTPNPDHETILLDLRCISWILRTSLDKALHLLAFKHLTSIPDLAHFHPTIVADCFNTFVGCISITNSKVVIREPGLEPLATEAANGFYSTLHHITTKDSSSGTLMDLRRRYNEIFSSEVDFTGLPFHSTMTKIHALAGLFGNPRDIQWSSRRMSVQEYIPSAQRMAKVAQETYQQRTQDRKVPRWTLHSALYFLSLGPLSPTSVVADSLTVVAVDLGCDVSGIIVSDESERVERISSLVTRELENMVEAGHSDPIISKRKAISTLLPYAILLEQGGQQRMINAISRAARVSDSGLSNHGKFMWHQVVLYISRLFEKQSPTSLDRVITLISPYVPWEGVLNNPDAVVRWAAAASATPYTNEIGQNVVDTLYQIVVINLLRPHIPNHVWGILKMQPTLPRMYHGIANGGSKNVIAYVRRLGDVGLLKSHFILVWADLYIPTPGETHAMKTSLRGDFGGAEMEEHRKGLLKRLNDVLEQLESMLEQSSPGSDFRSAKRNYTQLRDVLLELDKQ